MRITSQGGILYVPYYQTLISVLILPFSSNSDVEM
jgi:hypothetical protein